MSNPKQVYQLKITLDDVRPPIWRRLLVGEDTSLFNLHEIIQVAMGWQDYHLHMFTVDGQIYGDPEDDEFGDRGTKNETRYRLNKLDLGEKDKFKYEYDFGDGWGHTILVEKILPAEKGERYPVCLTGKRACPPEDVGGVWGYENFLEAIANPEHKEHDEYLEWSGGAFDPDAFDLEQINQRLHDMKPTHGGRILRTEPEKDEELAGLPLPSEQEQMSMVNDLKDWLNNLGAELTGSFEALPLRHDVLTFINYLSENQTVGTQSTGNLPLKAVHAICGLFVDPPKLEQTIGGHIFKVRSEDDVWPLLFVHTLAFHSRLVDGGPAHKWKPTPEGELFSQLPHPIQVVFLFVHWMLECDWTIAYQVEALADGLPDDFEAVVLNNLLALPDGQSVPYEPFVNHVIAESGLEWYSQDQSIVQMIKRSVVERVVIDPMIRFGVLDCTYRPSQILGGDYKDLDTIRLTSVGKALLALSKSQFN